MAKLKDGTTIGGNLIWHRGNQGSDSGLDADKLDGQHASYFASAASVKNSTISIVAGSGISGGGSFTLNQSSNASITLNHTDTSSQSSVNNSNGTVIQDISLDTYGHITSLGSVNLDSRYYTESESNTRYLRRNASSNPSSNNSFDLGSSSYKWANIYSTNFIGTSSSAKYADLAEKYTFKNENEIEIGKVVCISLDKQFDCEISNEINCKRIIGVISENPAFKMNSELENGYYVALKGKVKCYVKGPVKKGDNLVSYLNGSLINSENINDNKTFVIAKSLEYIDNDDIKLINVIIL